MLLAVLGCNKVSQEFFSDYVSSVTLVPTGNALRYAVRLEKIKDCSSRVCYRQVGEADWKTADSTMIFLLPDTEYEYMVRLGGDLTSDIQTFKTGSIPVEVPVYTVDLDEGGPSKGYLMQWQATNPGWLTFCDMSLTKT